MTRVFAVAFSDSDHTSGYSVAYFAKLTTARAFRRDKRAHGHHAVLSIEYLPPSVAGLINVR